MQPTSIDLLIHGAAELATSIGTKARGGKLLGEIRVLRDAAVAIRGETIVEVGPQAELRRRYTAKRELDARGGTLVPGFVDAHTHPVFTTTREDEFELRTRGATYIDIAAAGGGILSTSRGVRAASVEQLAQRLGVHLERFAALGTTTVEAKTGYGLSLDSELKCLQAIASARREHALDVVPTFLGAHDFPLEYRERKADYVQLVIEEMLPQVAQSKLAEYCDVFTEGIAFSLDDSRRILQRARALGLGLRLHVDQLTPLGGAELAAELGAASADHLEHVSERGIEALRDANVVPVLCPLVPLFLRQEREAPARRMIDAGLAVAISTDFNPGSCYLQSMPEVMSWAALRYRMSAAECLTAATLNAACSLGRGARTGTLEAGKRADVLVLDLPNHKHLVYELGRNPVRDVVCAGRVLARSQRGDDQARTTASALQP
jgi:imidazolonepropionase